MSRVPGQAARGLVKCAHGLIVVAIGAMMLAAVALGVLAWRLSQGPLDLSWFAGRLEAAVNGGGGPTRLSVGSVALAWEGFRQGLDRPIDLRLTGLRVQDAAGRTHVDIPRAEVSLSLGALLVGRMLPRALELDGAELRVIRGIDGTISLDLGSLREAMEAADPGQPAATQPSAVDLLAELARPLQGERSPMGTQLSQLRRVLIRDVAVTVVDRSLGVTWQVQRATVDLTRHSQGGVAGQATVALALGDQTADLVLSADMAQTTGKFSVTGKLTRIIPAALSRAAPGLASLAAVDAPVELEATADLDADMTLLGVALTARLGDGDLHVGQSVLPILSGQVTLHGSPDDLTIDAARLTAQGHDGAPLTNVLVGGTFRRHAGHMAADTVIRLDQVDFADLPRLWPEGVAVNPRKWILENVSAGFASNGHIELSLEGNADLSGIALTRAGGTMDGADLTVHWLRPVPPLDQSNAQMRIVDPDTIDVIVQSAHQRVSGRGNGLAVRGGRVRFTGLSQRDQIAEIQADVVGSLPDALSVLREPRLRLLDKHPMELKDAAGDVAVNLSVSVPLEHYVRVEDIGIHAVAHLTKAHVTGMVAGRDLDQGILDLDATTDGLTVKGTARVAGIVGQIDGMMDFRSGPPAQVVQRIVATGRAGVGQLIAAGLDPGDFLLGETALRATLIEHRNGDGEVAVDADLAQAVLAVPQLSWRKPVGVPAQGSARLVLNKDRLRLIDRIAVDGAGLSARATADIADNQIVALNIERAVVGRSEGHGVIRTPANGPIVAELSGPTVDLAAKLTEKAPKREKRKGEPPLGPAWSLDARFDQVLMAADRVATGFVATAENDGRVYRKLHIAGHTSPQAPFRLDIATDRGARRLTLSAADAGTLLRGVDYIRSMDGGRLAVNGTYDDSKPDHPLNAVATIEDFRVRNAAALGKLLQAMTFYGLVDVLRGPGIGFARLEAPLRLTDDELVLNDARAFSSSLGLTAKGVIDLNGEQCDVQGTIVPAYFFNSLLGNVPLVGKLFSPERGGGLFAAGYTLRGPLDDPSVVVNPLSALTPGFLRGLFGIF